MKKIFMPLMAVILTMAVSCNNAPETDPKDIAEEKNEAKMDSTNTSKMEDDEDFMVEAASGGMMEVQLGELALKNGSSAKVKEFGASMVKDHSKANAEMKALAVQKKVTLPTSPGGKHLENIDKIKDKKGADFDKDYISMMVDDHEEDIKEFEKEAKDGKDAAVKAFAASKVATLKHHLEMAKMIKDGMK